MLTHTYMQVTSLALESVEEKLERIFFARRRRGSFITTPRSGTRSRKESNRERSSAHTYQSLRRGISQRVSLIACAFACASKRRIKAVGVDPGSIFLAAPCHADAGIAECCSSSKTFAARLLREPSSVDYQAKRGVERGDQITHISSLATHSQSDGSSFFNPFPLQAAGRLHFSVYQPFIKDSVSSYNSSPTLACTSQHKHERPHNYSHWICHQSNDGPPLHLPRCRRWYLRHRGGVRYRRQ